MYFDVQSFIRYLVKEGYTKEEATVEGRKELELRKKSREGGDLGGRKKTKN